jgi:hypothetical protein
MIVNQDFSEMDPNLIPKDDHYVDCNFSRRQPDTSGAQVVGVRLFPGDDTPRVFTRCNLLNCEPPPNSIIRECNTWIITHDEPDQLYELVIDGIVEAQEQSYTRTIHARYTQGTYDRTGFPLTSTQE